MSEYTYEIHPDADVVNRIKDGYIYYVFFIKDDSVTVISRRYYFNSKNKTFFWVRATQKTLTIKGDGYNAVCRLFERLSPTGSLLNLSFETLLWEVNGKLTSSARVNELLIEEFAKLAEAHHIPVEIPNPFFNPVASIIFPSIRNGLTAESILKTKTDRWVLSQAKKTNPRIYKALQVRSAWGSIHVAFHKSWIATQEDLETLAQFNEWWVFGNWNVGMTVSELSLQVPDFLQLYKSSDFVLQMIALMSKFSSIDERAKMFRTCVSLLRAEQKRKFYHVQKASLKALTYEQKKSLSKFLNEKVLQAENIFLDDALEQFFSEWYSVNVLTAGLAPLSGTTVIDYTLAHFGYELSDDEVRVKQTQADSSLFLLRGTRYGDLNFAEYLQAACRDDNLFPSADIFFKVAGVPFSSRDGILVHESRLLDGLGLVKEEVDGQLVGLGQDVTVLNRQMFFKLPPELRSHKFAWKMVKLGVVDAKRIRAFKEAKISARKEVSEFNNLPDNLFYDIISQNDVKEN